MRVNVNQGPVQHSHGVGRVAGGAGHAYITETIGYEEEALNFPGAALTQRVRNGAHDARKFAMRDFASAVQRSGPEEHQLEVIVAPAEAARMRQRQPPVAYRIHSELPPHLVEMDSDHEIPREVFCPFPHTSAFTASPEPVVMSDLAGALAQSRPAELVGMFVTGWIDTGEVCSSGDPNLAWWLNVALAGQVFSTRGKTRPRGSYGAAPVTGVMHVEEMIRKQCAQDGANPSPGCRRPEGVAARG